MNKSFNAAIAIAKIGSSLKSNNQINLSISEYLIHTVEVWSVGLMLIIIVITEGVFQRKAISASFKRYPAKFTRNVRTDTSDSVRHFDIIRGTVITETLCINNWLTSRTKKYVFRKRKNKNEYKSWMPNLYQTNTKNDVTFLEEKQG